MIGVGGQVVILCVPFKKLGEKYPGDTEQRASQWVMSAALTATAGAV